MGVIDSVAVERGDQVRRGQTRALLKADVERASVSVSKARAESEADVHSAQVNLEFARKKLARAEDLARQKFIAPQMVEQLLAETKVAEQRLAFAREQQRIWRAEHALAQQQLSQRAIRAPFDGIIAERYITAGERIEEKPAVSRVMAALQAVATPARVEFLLMGATARDIMLAHTQDRGAAQDRGRGLRRHGEGLVAVRLATHRLGLKWGILDAPWPSFAQATSPTERSPAGHRPIRRDRAKR